MISNPLISPLRSLLESSASRYSEYALIRKLVDLGELEADYAANSLQLFRTHFRLMNALYQLQQEWLKDGQLLTISPLEIWLDTGVPEERGTRVTNLSAVGEFYMDWTEYDAATEETVDSLLTNFWQRYSARGVSNNQCDAALRTFGLSEPVDFHTIKQRYRRLAMTHHPDRGGDDESLQAINNAMTILTRAYSRF